MERNQGMPVATSVLTEYVIDLVCTKAGCDVEEAAQYRFVISFAERALVGPRRSTISVPNRLQKCAFYV